jgi:hypothetical protein
MDNCDKVLLRQTSLFFRALQKKPTTKQSKKKHHGNKNANKQDKNKLCVKNQNINY